MVNTWNSRRVIRKYNTTPHRFRNLSNPNSWHNRNRRAVQSHARFLINRNALLVKAKLAARRRRRQLASISSHKKHFRKYGYIKPSLGGSPPRGIRFSAKTPSKFARRY